MLNDPPGHQTYRSLVDKAFTSSKVASLEPRIQELIDELIDAFAEQPEIDFLQAFAVPLPMYVIAEQLGVAREDRAQFKRWSDVAMESVNPLLTVEDRSSSRMNSSRCSSTWLARSIGYVQVPMTSC